MNLNIEEMLAGDPGRLRYVNRYSTYPINRQENVAEHSFYVAFYANMVALWCEDLGQEIDWKNLMTYATIHDMEEARTGDVPRAFKYSTELLKGMLNKSADTAMRQIVDALLSGGGPDSLDGVSDNAEDNPLYDEKDWLLDAWRSAKSETIEGSIVAFADFLSVLSYLVQEMESGNRFAIRHAPSLIEYFKTFDCERFQFLGSLLVDVEKFIVKHYPEYYDVSRGSIMSKVPRVYDAEGSGDVRMSEPELRDGAVSISSSTCGPDGNWTDSGSEVRVILQSSNDDPYVSCPEPAMERVVSLGPAKGRLSPEAVQRFSQASSPMTARLLNSEPQLDPEKEEIAREASTFSPQPASSKTEYTTPSPEFAHVYSGRSVDPCDGLDLSPQEEEIVRDRRAIYGDSNVANTQLGLMWTAMIQQHYEMELTHPLPPDLVLLMQAAIKLCRLARKPDHLDSQKDAKVYLELAFKATRSMNGEGSTDVGD